MDTEVLLGLVQALMTAMWGILMWNFKDVKSKAEKASTDLAEYKVFVAEKYVSTEDMRDSVQAITKSIEQVSVHMTSRFDRIEDRIEAMRNKE